MPQNQSLPVRQQPMPRSEGVIDAIMVEPRSSGRLRLPGEYSTANRRPAYSLDISATNRDHVEHEEVLLGNADHHIVVVNVTNHNDSPAFASLKLVSPATQ